MKESPEELASLYLLDRLDGPERRAFEARMLREPAVAALVRDLEPALARAVQALPPQEPPATTLARIEARIEALAPAATRPMPGTGDIRWPAIARWGIAAVIAVSLATLAVQSLRPSAAKPTIVFVGLNTDRNTFADLPLREAGKDADARFIQLASLAENFWNKPGELPVKPDPVPGGSRGYALFDPGSQQGFIAIEQLPAIGETQRYHLWIVEPSTGRVRDAGILPLGGMSRGLYSFTPGFTGDQKSVRPNIFVTLEENGAVAQPRGKVVLGQAPL